VKRIGGRADQTIIANLDEEYEYRFFEETN